MEELQVSDLISKLNNLINNLQISLRIAHMQNVHHVQRIEELKEEVNKYADKEIYHLLKEKDDERK